MNLSVLITGGAGFIGSHFSKYLKTKYPLLKLVILDKLTYSGNLKNIKLLIQKKEVVFYEGDIKDKEKVNQILEKYQISHVINFAAETHVDNSINNPSDFIITNIIGTYNLLDTFKNYWEKKNKPERFRFLQISTDEVFGSLKEKDPPFNENSNYSPRSPYSASKAAGDHFLKAWFNTYNLPTIVSYSSNNYGPYQFPEKFIPYTITNILKKRPIEIYGDGENIRDWIFVSDHCKALDKILFNGLPGQSYCIGGNCEISNIDLVKKICRIIDEYKFSNSKKSIDLIKFIPDRPGHDRRYSLSNKYIERKLKWKPEIKLKDGLIKTVKWYVHNKNWWKLLSKKTN